MSEIESENIIGIIDVYTFAIQVLALADNDQHWNEDPAIAVHKYGQRIVSANKLAKQLGIDNTTKRSEAEEILQSNHLYDLKIFTVPAYPTRKPDQTKLREASRKIIHEILRVIPKAVIKWNIPPIVEWVPLDEVYFDLTEQVNYVIRNGTYYDVLYPNGIKAHMKSGFGSNIVTTPEDGVSLRNGPTAYPLSSTRNPKSKMYYGGSSPPTTKDDIRRALGLHYICKIMEHIHKATGLHCSGGVGPNKMLAKAACSMIKPGNLFYMNEAMFQKPKHAAKIPIKKLSVLDPELRRLLKEGGAENVNDIRQMLRKGFMHILGLSRSQFSEILVALSGTDSRHVVEKHGNKRINCAKSYLYRPLHNHRALKFHLGWLLNEFQQRLEEESKEGRKPEKMFAVFTFENGTFTSKTLFHVNNIDSVLLYLTRNINFASRIGNIRISGVRLDKINKSEDFQMCFSLHGSVAEE